MDITTLQATQQALRDSLGLPSYLYLPYASIFVGLVLMYRLVGGTVMDYPRYFIGIGIMTLVIVGEVFQDIRPALMPIAPVQLSQDWDAKNLKRLNEANAWLSLPPVQSPTYGDVFRTVHLLQKEAAKTDKQLRLQRSLRMEGAAGSNKIEGSPMSQEESNLLLQHAKSK